MQSYPSGRSLAELPELVAALPSLSEEDAAAFSSDLDQARRELAHLAPNDLWTS